MNISLKDLHEIKNESSLIEFLKEKLNIPIPNGVALEDISSKYSNYALGLNESNSKQVLDCKELSLTPGQPSGILIIRFLNDLGYSSILHAISNTLRLQGKNHEDFRFICLTENYQPFAIAYIKDAKNSDSSDTELYILAWTQEKVTISTNTNHVIPDIFIHQQEELQITSEDLLVKLEMIGTPLGELCDINNGITTGYNPAFIINDEIRNRLITEHQDCEDIIKLGIGKHQERRWKPSYKNIIWIPSSKSKNWQWSNAISESIAENIFQETYPTISKHLSRYTDEIKNRNEMSRGEFYWELPFQEYDEKFQGPKITIYDKPPIMAFYDKSDAIVINPYVYCIQTSDLSILGILNSSLFNWYAHTKFKTKGGGCLNKSKLRIVPISTNQSIKELITDLVHELLNTNDNNDISVLEDKIDMLVYKMYQLTDEEIDYVKNSLSKLNKHEETVKRNKLSDGFDSPRHDDSESQETKEMKGISKTPNTDDVPQTNSIGLENDSTRKHAHIDKLLAKIQKNGTPLINHAEMYGGPGITPPLNKAFVIDEEKRHQFINADSKNDELIIPVVNMPNNCKWKPEWRYLINISNSEFKLWPWSDANNEESAEKIFSEMYPSISQHIFQYKNELIDKSGIGRFYWELSIKEITKEEYPRLYQPKIVYPAAGLSIGAGYDTTESPILFYWTCIIPTTDLVLLGILNSNVFQWYAGFQYQANYKYKNKNWLTFKKSNMKNYPIPDRTEERNDIFEIVQLIIEDPNNALIPELEEEIDQLVYKLYDLTPAEIDLIEEETSK
ncbi:hypothetical protein C6497_11200 [Candidatus Poribacteria bacterium]|nr:MAG: hypothetical protein C6497_11200 [Candidatus Poribacteria bacterium]